MNTKELKKFNSDDFLHDTLLTMAFAEQLIDNIIHDTKIELKEIQRIKRSIAKNMSKGKAFYKEKHGRGVRLKT
jgi:hypothetical protein